MTHKARCPKCQEIIKHTKIESLAIFDHYREHGKCIAFLCPECDTILGTGFDPEMMVTEILRELKKGGTPYKLNL